jgi:hypothetical protein
VCSLVQTCKHLQINPFIYLRDVIERVSTHPARLVLELTPREWKRLRHDSVTRAAARTARVHRGTRAAHGFPGKSPICRVLWDFAAERRGDVTC